MPATPRAILEGLILDDDCRFTLDELSTACSVRSEYIVELIEEGIVEPMDLRCERRNWRFTGRSLLRARKARRLQQDLGVNLAGVALALELIEEIEQLRARLQRPGPL